MKCQLNSAHMFYCSSWAVVTRLECKQKPNSVTTGVMIKLIREMSPSYVWQFEVKHIKMPCSCTPFSRTASLYMHYFTDQTHLPACMSSSSLLLFWIYLFILLCFPHARLVLLQKVSEWSHKGELSGEDPSSSFLHTVDLEIRIAQRPPLRV